MTRAERIAALELEAERLKARLDVMHEQIEGDPAAWLQITQKMSDTVAEVYVDKVLSEARQHATALAGIVKVLESLEGAGEQAPTGTQADPADDVARKRQEKLNAARSIG